MAKLEVTQVRSGVGRPEPQKRTLRALGLKRMHHTVIKDDRPEIRGMISRVSHLVQVKEVS